MEHWMKTRISIMMILVISVSYTATGEAKGNLLCRELLINGTECDGNKKCPINDSCKDHSQCPCMDGYRSHNDTIENRFIINCEDIQECIEGTHECGSRASCNNTNGGYFCACQKGFHRGNITDFCPTNNRTENACLDIDECKDDPDICGPNAICYNTRGSFYCVCMSGYTEISIRCTDIDECKENTNICGPNAICENTIGSYQCVCMSGHSNISNQCTDIDECKENTNICGPNANCENVWGSYQCACMSGYRSISNQCTECTSNVTQIEYLQHCTNQAIEDPFCSVLNVSIRFLKDFCQNNDDPKKKVKEDLKQVAEKLSKALANNSIITENIHKRKLITGFLYSMERVVLISFLEEPRVQHINTSELDITLKPSYDICSSGVQSFTLDSADNFMEVPCNLVHGDRGGAILITYKEFNFYHGNYPGQNNEAVINSRLVTGAITNPDSKNLQSPVTFRLSHLQPLRPFFKFICVFWDPVRDSWSDEGCETGQSVGTHTTCSCSHLSSFTLLMAPHEIQVHFSPLTIISYIGLSISVVCLCLSLLTFILCRSLRNSHTSVLSGLCGCLFLGQLLFMVGINQTWNKLLCAFIAGSLQFLFLGAFCWMSIESVLLFMTVRNLSSVNYMASRKSNVLILCLLGFGIPAVIVGISAAAHPHAYGTKKLCWLCHRIVWSFLGPVCAFITINTTLLVLTFWLLKKRMASLNANVSTLKNTRLMTFKAVAQFFILGCTWVIGYFQFGPQSLVISYLFTICNSLQGFYIFLVHCLLNQQVREEYCKLFSRHFIHKKQKQDTFTISTLQTASKPPLTASTDCISDCALRQSTISNTDVVSTDNSPAEKKEQSV